MSVSHRTSLRTDLAFNVSEVKPDAADQRSKLHTNSTITWIKKRYQSTANINYLLFPEETQAEVEVRNVFNFIDEDKSGKLSLHEFYKMLRQANIRVKMEDLKKFFNKFDIDHDTAFDYHEFKNCTLSDQANQDFGQMMDNIRRDYENRSSMDGSMYSSHTGFVMKDLEEANAEGRPFIPRTFGSLLNYLAYTIKKSNLLNFISDENNSGAKKIGKFVDLIDLKIDKDMYMRHYNQKLESKSPSLSPSISFRSSYQKGIRSASPSPNISIDYERFNEQPMSSQPLRVDMADLRETKKFMKEINELAESTRKQVRENFMKGKVQPRKPLYHLTRLQVNNFPSKDGKPVKIPSSIKPVSKKMLEIQEEESITNETLKNADPEPIRKQPSPSKANKIDIDLTQATATDNKMKKIDLKRIVSNHQRSHSDVNSPISMTYREPKVKTLVRLGSIDHGNTEKKYDIVPPLQMLHTPKYKLDLSNIEPSTRGSRKNMPTLSNRPSPIEKETTRRSELLKVPAFDMTSPDLLSKFDKFASRDPVNLPSKMPFNYDSVSPKFDYYKSGLQPSSATYKMHKRRPQFLTPINYDSKDSIQSARSHHAPLSSRISGPTTIGKGLSHFTLSKKISNEPLGSPPATETQIKDQISRGHEVLVLTRIELRGEGMKNASGLDSSLTRE